MKFKNWVPIGNVCHANHSVCTGFGEHCGENWARRIARASWIRDRGRRCSSSRRRRVGGNWESYSAWEVLSRIQYWLQRCCSAVGLDPSCEFCRRVLHRMLAASWFCQSRPSEVQRLGVLPRAQRVPVSRWLRAQIWGVLAETGWSTSCFCKWLRPSFAR